MKIYSKLRYFCLLTSFCFNAELSVSTSSIETFDYPPFVALDINDDNGIQVFLKHRIQNTEDAEVYQETQIKCWFYENIVDERLSLYLMFDDEYQWKKWEIYENLNEIEGCPIKILIIMFIIAL